MSVGWLNNVSALHSIYKYNCTNMAHSYLTDSVFDFMWKIPNLVLKFNVIFLVGVLRCEWTILDINHLLIFIIFLLVSSNTLWFNLMRCTASAVFAILTNLWGTFASYCGARKRFWRHRGNGVTSNFTRSGICYSWAKNWPSSASSCQSFCVQRHLCGVTGASTTRPSPAPSSLSSISEFASTLCSVGVSRK